MATSTPKKPAEEAPPSEPRRPSPSESSDPAVHHLLARRATLAQWDEQNAAEIVRLQGETEKHRPMHDEINAQLADLGY